VVVTPVLVRIANSLAVPRPTLRKTKVGAVVGADVGDSVGAAVGADVGDPVDAAVGADVGDPVDAFK